MQPSRVRVVTLLFVTLLPKVHWSTSLAHSAAPETAAPRGLVIVVGGVGGIDVVGSAAQWALPRAGIHHEVLDFTWGHGRGRILKDLQDLPHSLHKAAQVAELVLQAKARDPNRPIYLVGKSGGSGLVLAAAGQLPPATLERIILLSAAVSPTYDLRDALRATRHEIVSFYSPLDQFILGWGTRQFGTIDRFYGTSAGLRGFIVPRNLNTEDEALYKRLVQLPWNPRMIWEGHMGGHMGTSMPAFVGKEVAPWLRP